MVYQRDPLHRAPIRRGIVNRGGLFTGTAGGKLLALDAATGALAWEGNVATRKARTSSSALPMSPACVIDERQVCAAAYLGRIACFESAGHVTGRGFGSLGVRAGQSVPLSHHDKGACRLWTGNRRIVWKQDSSTNVFPAEPSSSDYLA